MTASAGNSGASDGGEENREYIRRLLRTRQPRFAAALETAVQELMDELCEPTDTETRG